MTSTATSSQSSFKLLQYFPFPLKTTPLEPNNHSTSINKTSNQPNNKPACIAILVGRDGIPVTKCIAPGLRDNRSLAYPPKKQKHLSSLRLPKFRSCRRGSSSSKVLPLYDRLQHLPSELLIQITAYLDLSSVLSLSTTSRFYQRLCSPAHNYLWHAIYRSHYPHHPTKVHSLYYSLVRDLYALNRRFYAGDAQSHYLIGHQDSVYCIAWINSHQILSGSRDRTIKMWDVDQHECLITRHQHQGSVLCLAVANDRSFFISGSSDSTVARWSLPDMTCRQVMHGHTGGILDVCLVDDTWIVSSSRDTSLRVWNAATGRSIHPLVGHQGPINALESIKSSRTHVLSASGDTTLKLWDVETAQCLRTFIGHQRGLACVRFDPFRGSIISGGQDGKIKVWDMESAECLHTMTGHGDLVRTVGTFQGTVVSGSYDRTLRVWDSSTGTCLLSFHSGHTSWIFNVLINSTKVISAGQDKKIMILDFGYGLNNL